MKSGLIALTVLFLVPSFAYAQQTSIANPAPAAPGQTAAAKSKKTTDEVYQACMDRHVSKQRVGKNTARNCANAANRKTGGGR